MASPGESPMFSFYSSTGGKYLRGVQQVLRGVCQPPALNVQLAAAAARQARQLLHARQERGRLSTRTLCAFQNLTKHTLLTLCAEYFLYISQSPARHSIQSLHWLHWYNIIVIYDYGYSQGLVVGAWAFRSQVWFSDETGVMKRRICFGARCKCNCWSRSNSIRRLCVWNH